MADNTSGASALLRRILADEQAVERVARRVFRNRPGVLRGTFDDEYLYATAEALEAAAEELEDEE